MSPADWNTTVLLTICCLALLTFGTCFSPSSEDPASLQPSSVPSNQSRGFSNYCQLFAW